MRAMQEAGSSVKAQYEDKLVAQEEMFQIQLASGQQRIDDAQKALEDTRSMLKGLEEQVAAGRQDIVALKEELREAKLPSPARKEAIDALQAETAALRTDNTELVLRARSIDARYRVGDLVYTPHLPPFGWPTLTPPPCRMKRRKCSSTHSFGRRNPFMSRS